MEPTALRCLRVQENGMYHVKVSLRSGNPPFWCILLVGFVQGDSAPGSYSKLVGTTLDEIEIDSEDFYGAIVHECLYIAQQRDAYEA